MKNRTCRRRGIERRDVADSHTCVYFLEFYTQGCSYFLEFYTEGCWVQATCRTLHRELLATASPSTMRKVAATK